MEKQHLIYLLAIIAVTLAVSSDRIAAPDIIPRIINGTYAEEGEFRYMVSLRINGEHACGATILNQRHILTAAHCVCNLTGYPQDPKQFSIKYGSVKLSDTQERTVPVASITCNKYRFILDLFPNDIAVVKLAHDIPNDGTWETVKISKDYNATSEGKGIIIGWGWDNNYRVTDSLKKLEVDIYNDTLCTKYDKDQHLCLGGNGSACYNDSGSPLVTLDNIQLGIGSWITFRCRAANRTYPNIYTRVNNFYTWVQENSKL